MVATILSLMAIGGLTMPSLPIMAQVQPVATNAACGQVVSGLVNLTANLDCSGDGLIIGGDNTVVNMNGYSITGPGPDSSKVGIMVPNNDNVVINGPGSISNFQAGVLVTGANGMKMSSLILNSNQIGVFMTGSENTEVQQNIIKQNSLGVATHSQLRCNTDLQSNERKSSCGNYLCEYQTIGGFDEQYRWKPKRRILRCSELSE